MRTLLLALALATATPAAAQTAIGPGDTFLLGGEQQAPFTAAGRNTGKVPVVLLARTGSLETRLREVVPGETFEQVIGPGQVAMFRNPSRQQAEVDIRLDKRSSSLAMRYALPPKAD